MNDTEKAIEFLEEHMPPLEDYGEMIGAPPQYCGIKYVYNDPCGYAFETAIQALQEKAERDKGCEYCKDEKSMPTGNKNTGFYLAGEALTYTAQAAADDDFEDNTFVNYCPMCGRKLTSAPTDER